MIKLITTVFLLATIFTSNAQDVFQGKIKWGEPFSLKRKEVGPFPIGQSNGKFYSTKRKKNKTSLQTFDLQSLSLEKESGLILKYQEHTLNIVSSFVFGSRVIFITNYIDKQEKKKHYLLHELKGNDVLGKPIELAKVAWSKKRIYLTSKSLEKVGQSGENSFRFIVSEDYETLMVSYRLEDEEETNTLLLDKDLNEVNRSKFKVPFENFSQVNSRLSNTGRYYMVGYEFTKEQSEGLIKREITKTGDYHVLVYDAVEGEIEDIDIKLPEEINSIDIKVFENESIIAYGMYSKEYASGISGSFFIKINSDRSIEYTELEEFEEDFITQHWTPRQKKKAEKKKKKKNPNKKREPSLYSYVMHDLVIKENGDMVLLAEQYYMYVTSHTYTDANGNSHTTYTYHYIYNDIIAVNCTPQGEITWKQKVKKRQHSTNDGGYYSSFFTMVQGDNVFMIYNDKEANMDDASEVNRKAKKNTVAAIITLTEGGKMKRETLFDFEGEQSRTLVPKRCENMSENEILIYTHASRRTSIFGWVTL